MSIDQIFTIIGAIIAGAGGIYIVIHEVRRRERKTVHRELTELATEIQDLYVLLLEQRRYIYKIVMAMIDAGIDVPPPPDPSFDKDEYSDAEEE